jgi:threonine synthase
VNFTQSAEKMMNKVCCTTCGSEYPPDGTPYCCPVCGGIYDLAVLPEFTEAKILRGETGLWRYRSFLNLPAQAPVVTLGEGLTPLVWTDDSKQVGCKLEYLNPTGSYKDRGSAVLTSWLLSRGIDQAVEDSSGNAGASFAAYAARAGIKARVFIPESASGPKRKQIEMFGAQVVPVPGPRSAAAAAVLQDIRDAHLTYASHAYLPFGLAGIATIAYELVEQLNNCAPGTIIAPIGHGGLLLGIVRGFQSLASAGIVTHLPYFVGAQAAACAPIVSMRYPDRPLPKESDIATVAEGVRVRTPLRGEALLKEILPAQGDFVAVEEEKILPACEKLARLGLFVEPTSALAWCAYEQLMEKLPKPVVLILTGSGLKYSHF